MLRLIFAICLLLLSGAVSYYFLLNAPEVPAPKRPEISEKKKAVIAKRAVQQEQDLKQDQAHEESVLDLERYYK
jgi:Flp pilus assembly protein CpaB